MQENKNNQPNNMGIIQEPYKHWYNNKFITHLLLIFFLPIGLYALWKSNTIAKWWKITATIILGSILLFHVKEFDSSNGPLATAKESPDQELTQAEMDSIAEVKRVNTIKERKNNTISATDLVAVYEDNEVAADNNFKGKNFYVEGYIKSIGKDIIDHIYVTLESENSVKSVQCYINDPEKVAQLKKGQKITVFGHCKGLMLNLHMENCKLVQNLEDL